VFSSPIFTGSASFSWFCVSLPPPRENTSGGGVFIEAFLGQAEQYGVKMDGIGGPRAKQTWVARLGLGPAPPGVVGA
jgi:hypothetical protein